MTSIHKKDINFLPLEIKTIVNTLKLSNSEIQLNGSNGIKNVIYPNDFDLVQNVKYDKNTTNNFRNIILKLIDFPDLYICDIKIGEVKEAKILPDDCIIRDGKVINYNYKEIKKQLLKNKYLYEDDEYILKKTPSITEYFRMKSIFKKHVLRWTAEDVLNKQILFHGQTIQLSDALQMNSRCKLDIVVFLNGQYTEFSIIYIFPFTLHINEQNSLRNDIFIFHHEHNYFKMAKRIFSFMNNDDVLKNDLLDMFNGEIGIMYNISQSLKTLLYILENEKYIRYFNIKHEIEYLKLKFSNITIRNYLEKETSIMKLLDKIARIEPISSNKNEYISSVQGILTILDKLINDQTEKELRKLKLIPLPEIFTIV